MRIAVDVCIGRDGIDRLRRAGHDVYEAEHCESDRDWFSRAIAWGADLFVSADADIEIYAYDANVDFFLVRQGECGERASVRLLTEYEEAR